MELAARQATIVSIVPNFKAGSIGMHRGPTATANATDQRVEWVRAAAGDRLAEIEINAYAFLAEVTGDRTGASARLGEQFGLDGASSLMSPSVLVGSTEAIVDDLYERRERWGISYITVQEQVPK